MEDKFKSPNDANPTSWVEVSSQSPEPLELGGELVVGRVPNVVPRDPARMPCCTVQASRGKLNNLGKGPLQNSHPQRIRSQTAQIIELGSTGHCDISIQNAYLPTKQESWGMPKAQQNCPVRGVSQRCGN